MTPHNAAVTQPDDVAAAFAANLARFQQGGTPALEGVFSWGDGY